MARQVNGINLEGTVGNLTFYKSKDGYLVRRKSSLSKKRIKTDPAFATMRKLNAEFSRAAEAVRAIRVGFAPLLRGACDHKMTGRLIGAMLKAIHADLVNPCGKRTPKDGQLQLLEGFEFNEKAHLKSILRAPFDVSFDRDAGEVALHIPAFSVSRNMSIPPDATHFRILCGCAVIDFEYGPCSFAQSESTFFERTRKRIGPLHLIQKMKLHFPEPLFVLLGVEFLVVDPAGMRTVSDGEFNGLGIVKLESLYDSN